MILRIGSKIKAFTLVELLISVVILGFGLCVVIRSYMSSLSALDTSQNYVEATRLTQTKLSELELLAVDQKGLEPFHDSGESLIGARKASWKIEVGDIQEPREEEIKEDFVMAQVSVSWQERNAPRNSALVTYLPKYKKDEKKE